MSKKRNISRRDLLVGASLPVLSATSGCALGSTVRSDSSSEGGGIDCNDGGASWPTGGRRATRTGRAAIPGELSTNSTVTGAVSRVQPVAGHGSAFFVGEGVARALPIADGPEWTRRVDGITDAEVVANPVLGCGALYVPTSGGVVALSVTDGTIRWRAGDVRAKWRTSRFQNPSAWGGAAVAGGTLYTVVRADDRGLRTTVAALDAETGRERWRLTPSEGSYSAVAYAGRAYVAGETDSEGTVAAVSSDGAVEWTRSLSGRAITAPTVVDGTVYVTTQRGEASALDAGTGREQWRAASPALAGEMSAPLDRGAGGFPAPVRDGTVFLPDDEGIVALETGTGRTRWHTDTGFHVGQPIAGPERLLVAYRDVGLVALDPGTGERLGTAPAPEPRSGPVVADGRVIYVDERGRIVIT
jgi:outer membrane protein assembly factor BamB